MQTGQVVCDLQKQENGSILKTYMIRQENCRSWVAIGNGISALLNVQCDVVILLETGDQQSHEKRAAKLQQTRPGATAIGNFDTFLQSRNAVSLVSAR